MQIRTYASPIIALYFGIVLYIQAQEAADHIPGIGPAGEVQKVAGDFQFTEGPAWDGKDTLLFTDIPNNRIMKLDSEGQISIFREPSFHANGLMFDAKGNVIACEMDGRIAKLSADGKDREVVVAQYKGKRFNACNDLVIDRQGGIYFTDPQFRAPKPFPQGTLGVYYADATGEVQQIIESLPNPNGIILSPDEKLLYVIPSSQSEMLVYQVLAPGKIGESKEFCKLKQAREGANGGGDGLTIDVKGNLYITTGLGIQVFSPDGKLLGILKFPEQPANVTFGGPENKTLYVTARTSLYSVKMEIEGHRFAVNKD